VVLEEETVRIEDPEIDLEALHSDFRFTEYSLGKCSLQDVDKWFREGGRLSDGLSSTILMNKPR
jgi:hypothetical protein